MTEMDHYRQSSGSSVEKSLGSRTTSGPFHRVGLLDHIGLGNMGDTAIQEVFITNIKQRLPNAAIIAFSLNPSDTRARHDVDAYPITPFVVNYNSSGSQSTPSVSHRSRLKSFVKQIRSLYVALRTLRGCLRQAAAPIRELAHILRSYRIVRSLDLLVISGGGQFSDLWAGMPYNLFKFCLLAKLSGTKLFIVSAGAGPLRGSASKMFATWAVRFADYVSFRDAESLDFMRRLDAQIHGFICPDPVYAFDVQPYLVNKGGKTHSIKVGLNPMGYCDHRVWPVRNESAYRSYIDKLMEVSLWLLEHDCHLELFTTDNICDRYAIQDLVERVLRNCSLRDASRVTARPLFGLQGVLRQIAGFDVVITSKFHGVIFSHILTKPVLALGYHPKIRDLMRSAGHERHCFNIGEFDTHSVIDALGTLLSQGDELRDSYRETVANWGAAVQSQFDHLFAEQSRASLVAPEQEQIASVHREPVHSDLRRGLPVCDRGAK